MLKTQEMKDKIKVHLSTKIQNQIRYLCTEISAVEWSGIIFYTVEGDIEDPTNLKIIPQEILPLDKGTGAFTKYEFGVPAMNFMHKHDAIEKDWIVGHIHSHNNMSVFFSGTDDSELRDNCPNHRFYFSIIVNNKQEMCAKVALLATTELSQVPNVAYIGKNKEGESYEVLNQEFSIPEKLMVVYDCEIEREDFITEDFKDLTKNINSHVGSSLRHSSENSYKYPKDYRNNNFRSYDNVDDENDETFLDQRVSTIPKDRFAPKTRPTRSNLKAFLPNLITYKSNKKFEEIEDALDEFIIEKWDVQEVALHLKENFNKIIDQNFEAAHLHPIFNLRSIVDTLKLEVDTYKNSKKVYVDILKPLHETLKKSLEEIEGKLKN